MTGVTMEIPPIWNHYGISRRDYLAMAKLSNACEDKLGIETVGIEKVKLGSGCVVELASGQFTYELKVERGMMVLGRVSREGVRQKLFTGGIAVAMDWEKLVDVVRASEKGVRV